MRPTRPEYERSGCNATFSLRAASSTHQKPALWRVASYSGPGLPRPTNSLIMVHGSQVRPRLRARRWNYCRQKGKKKARGCGLSPGAPAAYFLAAGALAAGAFAAGLAASLPPLAGAALASAAGAAAAAPSVPAAASAADSSAAGTTTDTSTGFGLPCVT